jgi:Flp pilus assembly protein TadG
MNRPTHTIASDQRGVAAAEFALVMPLLFIVTFCIFDLSRLMLAKTTVDAAVADSARFAARLPMNCSSLTTSGDVDRVKTLTRTGRSTSGGIGLVRGWDLDSSVSVTVACLSNTSGGLVGTYDNMLNVPHVTVTATVPFRWSMATLLNLANANVVAAARQPWTG